MPQKILYIGLIIYLVTTTNIYAIFNSFHENEKGISLSEIVVEQNFKVIEGSTTGTIIDTIIFENQGSDAVSFILKDAEFQGISKYPKGDSAEDPEFDPMRVVTLNSASGEIRVQNAKYLLAVLSPLYLNVEIIDDKGDRHTTQINITIEDKEVTVSKIYELDWIRLADHPNSLFEGAGGFVDATFYTFGGFTFNFSPRPDVHGYLIPSDTWIRYKDMPPMASNSGSGGATHMGWTHDAQGTIYIAAGFAANTSGNGQQFGSKRVYSYNTLTDDYVELPSLPIDRAAGNLHYYDNKLFYIAGTNKPRDTDQSDVLVLNLNDLVKGWEYRSPMPNPRHHSGSVLLNGIIYILGGQKEHDDKLVPQDDVHGYNPETDTWTYITDMPKPFNHIHASTFGYKGYIFTVGGQIEHNKGGFKEVYAYHPSKKIWVQFTDLPAARYAMVADTYENQIYAVGGSFSKNMFTALLPEDFLDQTLSVIGNVHFLTVSIYPNPVEDVLYIDHKPKVKSITLKDLQGKQIEIQMNPNTSDVTRTSVNLGNLTAGMYILQITTRSDQTHFAKVIKK